MQKAYLMVLWLSLPQPMLISRPLWLHLSGSDGVGAVMIPSFRTQAHISRFSGGLTSFWHHCGSHLWESAKGNFLTRLLSPPGSGTLPFLVDFFPSFRSRTQQLWIPQCRVWHPLQIVPWTHHLLREVSHAMEDFHLPVKAITSLYQKQHVQCPLWTWPFRKHPVQVRVHYWPSSSPRL